jgi:hypothetical protein
MHTTTFSEPWKKNEKRNKKEKEKKAARSRYPVAIRGGASALIHNTKISPRSTSAYLEMLMLILK